MHAWGVDVDVENACVAGTFEFSYVAACRGFEYGGWREEWFGLENRGDLEETAEMTGTMDNGVIVITSTSLSTS